VLLWHILRVKPFAGLSILLCLATIFSCFLLERRRPRQSSDRFLIAVLGLLSVYQGLRILHNAGLVSIIGNTMDDAIEVVITTLYLGAALLLRWSAAKHLDAESAIRLARAAPPRSSQRMEPLRDFSLETISWAIPRVSDGAFKLYALLCLHAGYNAGRVPAGVQNICLQLGKTQEELDQFLGELQKAGAVQVSREGSSLNIELLAQNRRNSAPVLDEIPRTRIKLPA
jgi:hypothetical protein